MAAEEHVPRPLLQNSSDESVPWVVQKYGGTSVGKFLDNIGDVAESYLPNSKVAIVCSARSGTTKARGTTNLLLRASKEALRPAVPSTPAEPASGTQTPFYPKRVGSGFFSGNEVRMTPSTASSAPGSNGNVNGTLSLSSSIASLRDLKLAGGNNSAYARSGSPSPFQSSSSSAGPGQGNGNGSGSNTAPGSGSSSPTSSGFLNSNSSTPTGTGAGGYSSTTGPFDSASQLPPFHATVDILKKDHIAAARASIKDPELLLELEEEITRDVEGLRSFLSAAQIIDEISPRSQDSIIGIGERLACKIVAAALRDRGIDSELVSLEYIVDATLESLEDANITSTGDQGVAQLDQGFYDRLAARLGERLRQCGNRVPVITGYFGVVPGSLLAQIGRGYTDLCAALCAVGVGASELQIWKEVDGIFTADPRKVPTARLVPIITPDEAAELTYYGSEVIHPFTMEQVIRAKIPIRIKNVENPTGEGTVIYPQPDSQETDAKLDAALEGGQSLETSITRPADKNIIRLPTAVTIKDSIIVLNIHSNRKTISHGFLARIFGTLDRAGVVVDLISTSEVHVSMALQDFIHKKQLDRLVKDLEKIGHITVSRDMAILSLVGRQMRHMVGIAGKMFATLAEGNINIEMISQGASEINISCVIDNRDSIKALNLIHQSCLTSPPVANVLQF